MAWLPSWPIVLSITGGDGRLLARSCYNLVRLSVGVTSQDANSFSGSPVKVNAIVQPGNHAFQVSKLRLNCYDLVRD